MTVSDKLKWYRIQSGFLQRDIAKAMEIDRTTYLRYESNVLDAYPLDKLSKAADLFGIELPQLLDDYNLFLYLGQGQQMKKLRKSMGITQLQLAQLMGISLGTLKPWERNKVNMMKSSFQKLLKLNKALIDL